MTFDKETLASWGEIHIGVLIGNAVGAVFALVGQITTPVSLLAWVGVISYTLLAFGFGYCF